MHLHKTHFLCNYYVWNVIISIHELVENCSSGKLMITWSTSNAPTVDYFSAKNSIMFLAAITWVVSNEDTNLQLGGWAGLSTPILEHESQPAKKKRTPTKHRFNGNLVYNQHEVSVEQSPQLWRCSYDMYASQSSRLFWCLYPVKSFASLMFGMLCIYFASLTRYSSFGKFFVFGTGSWSWTCGSDVIEQYTCFKVQMIKSA